MSSPFDWSDLRLRVHLLTFEVQATTPITLPPFKGSALRGAWKHVLTRAYCPALPEDRKAPHHAESCPACYLTERENDPEARKPYAFRPPLTRETNFPPGAALSFGMVLFGPAWLLLPYVISAVKQMGEGVGIGKFQPQPTGRPRRGRFRLQAMYLEHPYQRPGRELIFTHADKMVFVPQNSAITAQDVAAEAQRRLQTMPDPVTLVLHFRTPLRLVHRGHLMHPGAFSFLAFYQRLVERLYMLARDFGDPPLEDTRSRLREVMHATLPLAKQVQVVEERTWWWDFQGYSTRLKRKQPLGGLMGEVVLRAPKAVWEALLIPILWGEITHLGKNAVKGQGWYKVSGASGTSEQARRERGESSAG